MWGYFKVRLKTLLEYDATTQFFITLPEDKIKFRKTILSYFPNAKVILVKNKGRDVLPFIDILNEIVNKYDFLLKIHSKKSKHRLDGSEWLEDLVESLISDKKDILSSTIAVLQKEDTGIIGPSGQYLPLAINLPANGKYIRKFLRKKYHYFKTRKVLKNSFDYGFFFFFLFWASLDALMPIIYFKISEADFSEETGQIDGTLAHALERLLCLIPELDGKRMYEIDKKGTIVQIPYSSDNIPEWSDLHNSERIN